jgi:membrane protease YdiL (CAAX protease family)
VSVAVPRPRAFGAPVRTVLLLAGLAAALAVRVGIAGTAGVRSAPAGVVFAALLLAVATAAGLRPASLTLRQAAVGGAGGLALCAVPLVVHLRTPGGPLPLAALPVWTAVVSAVAVAEEVLLRGALWDAATDARGTAVALVVTTVAFGLLHVPLYGWDAFPLDLAVGLLLGGLRLATGSWGAPAVAHTLADLAGWWLR